MTLGPFRPRDIDWLAMPTAIFAAIRPKLPRNLKLTTTSDTTVILGYDHV